MIDTFECLFFFHFPILLWAVFFFLFFFSICFWLYFFSGEWYRIEKYSLFLFFNKESIFSLSIGMFWTCLNDQPIEIFDKNDFLTQNPYDPDLTSIFQNFGFGRDFFYFLHLHMIVLWRWLGWVGLALGVFLLHTYPETKSLLYLNFLGKFHEK